MLPSLFFQCDLFLYCLHGIRAIWPTSQIKILTVTKIKKIKKIKKLSRNRLKVQIKPWQISQTHSSSSSVIFKVLLPFIWTWTTICHRGYKSRQPFLLMVWLICYRTTMAVMSLIIQKRLKIKLNKEKSYPTRFFCHVWLQLFPLPFFPTLLDLMGSGSYGRDSKKDST